MRMENWDWFETDKAENAYTFGAATLRLGLSQQKEKVEWLVEGGVPGPRDGYVTISKAKKPPRERRGFSGVGTVDPLKAAKKAAQAAKKKV